MFQFRALEDEPAALTSWSGVEEAKAFNGPRPIRSFLFITAPFGTFSKVLAKELRLGGAVCRRVLMNGGDICEWGFDNSVWYRGDRDGWSVWLKRVLRTDGVTDIICHGDSQSYAAEAIAVAKASGVNVHVFEQGYFRPHWVTLERDGVNAHSQLPRSPDFYRDLDEVPEIPPPVEVGRITPAAVRRIVTYHIWGYILRPVVLRNFVSPYSYTAYAQGMGHLRRYLAQRIGRKAKLAAIDRVFDGSTVFLALLQRPGDSQLTRHSRFDASVDFIREVVNSFAAHADPGARLLFKSHPLDHGLEPHARDIAELARTAGVGGRVFFADDGHFPTMIAKSHAVVSVNSTGGLAALEAGLPTLTLGDAIYDMPGLTHQAGLKSFWTTAEAPDADLFERYRAVVMAACQINGAFSTASGVALAAPEAARRLLASAPPF